MAFIYVTEQGAVLQKRGNRLVARKDEEVLVDMPAGKIDGVLIFGNVQFTTQALRIMMENGIELAFFSSRGRLLGQMTSPYPKNVPLRLAQYEKMLDENFVLEFSRNMARSKLENSVSFLKKFSRNHPDLDIGQEIEAIAGSIRSLESKTGVDSLLGVEGTAATVFFKAYGKMILREFEFEGRKKRPPTDPVNSLLSFGYTLIYNEISWLLDGMGFDPYMGFYHRPHYGHATLASDLMEQFRSPVVDRFTLNVVNNGIFKKEDFYHHAPSGGVYLTNESKKRYFAEYERFVRKESPTGDGEVASYRKLFLRQAERLKTSLQTGEEYAAYRLGR